MELILRIGAGEAARDVSVDVDGTHTIGDLAVALAGFLELRNPPFALTSKRTGRTLPERSTVADADLVSGDELVVGPAVVLRESPPLPLRAMTADVIAGPDSGNSMLLSPGRYRIGRSSEADLVIDDPSVSRHHVDVDVDDDWAVTVYPAVDAANGVTVNDELIVEPHVIGHDDVIGLGGSRLAFRPFVRSERERIDRLGQIDFHRTPYRPPTVAELDTQEVGPVPERPEPRRFQALALIAPLAAGVTMFAFTQQVQFLALTLVSPIVGVAQWYEDRRSGRRKFSEELDDFRTSLGERRTELEQLRNAERIERLRSAPDLADLSRRAELRTLDLWPRGRKAPDFMRLRLGLGPAPVSYDIEVDDGGSSDLREEAEAAAAGLDRLDNMPVTAALADVAVLGVHGERRLVDGVASSLTIQAATLHSPEDLTIVAAVGPERPLHWVKWLPHARSVASPLEGSHLVHSKDEADALIARLTEVAEFRTNGDRRRDDEPHWPRLFVVLDGDVRPDPAAASRLLDLAADADISVLWLAESAADVPRQAGNILGVRHGQGDAMLGRLWSTDPEIADQELEVDHLREHVADRVARSLAPVRDASTASLATSIPRTAPLLDVLGVGLPTAQWVNEQWLSRSGYQLRFPVGFGADGPIEIDLVENGPHSLIGGTSGAGKSELLQSMVAALAVRHPPTHLNFLFVDYKGGASSQVFGDLPHTVGYVTNLSPDLALRALTSLRAELNHRMAIMEGRAQDLAEMLRKHPDEAPASLVIIVDEFATLVKEVPEFVAGIVDIAQRGRSLGIHLVLATQRPSGSVNENILANTNLRISLRMLDRAESTSIIDSAEAADIPVPLRGRGFIRLGPRELHEFQSAYSSAPLATSESSQPVLVGAFERTDDSPRAASAASSSVETTHLQAVIRAVADASRQLALPEARRPWREVLPDIVTLHQVATDPRAAPALQDPGRHVVVGLLDDPARQDQLPLVIDLEQSGGWLVFGAGGSGKSTLLRTAATSISASAVDGNVAILVLDFASRSLAGLGALPEVVDVAVGDDIEAVTRHITVLERELDRRRTILAEAGSEHLSAYNHDHTPMPRIVLLIDGYDGVHSTFIESGGGLSSSLEAWADRLQRIVIDGRQVGIHTIITAVRRNSVPARIHSSISDRLVLRHSDEMGYSDHGISPTVARNLELMPGRGLHQAEMFVQIASVSTDADARSQNEYIAAFAQRLDRAATALLGTTALPADLDAGSLDPADGPLTAPIGISDVSAATVHVDLQWSHLTVCGPARSGRSTTLQSLEMWLRPEHDVFVLCPKSSPLASIDGPNVAAGRADDVAPLLERLANLVAMGPSARPRVLIVDDIEQFEDMSLIGHWETLAASDDLHLVVSMESRSMTGYSQNPMVNEARRARRLLVLQPDDPTDFLQTTGIKLPVRPGTMLPPGRGVLLVDRQPTVLQVARCDSP